MSARERMYRLLTLHGLLTVRPCPLCGALVVRVAREQHDRHHRSTIAEA